MQSPLKWVFSALVVSICCLPVIAFSGGDAIGSLPSAANSQSKTVEPGKEHTNKDDAKLSIDANSKGSGKISPEAGTGTDIETRITFKSKSIGTASGIDSNDTVDVGADADATISGDGGTVNLAGSAKANVTNTAAAGGSSIYVNTPDGGTTTIPPGGNQSF